MDDHDAPRRPPAGFQTYADDTLRPASRAAGPSERAFLAEAADAGPPWRVGQVDDPTPRAPKSRVRPGLILAALAAAGAAVAGVAWLSPAFLAPSPQDTADAERTREPQISIKLAQAAPTAAPTAPLNSRDEALRTVESRPLPQTPAPRPEAPVAADGPGLRTAPGSGAAFGPVRATPRPAAPAFAIAPVASAPLASARDAPALAPLPPRAREDQIEESEAPRRVLARLPAPLNCDRPASPAQAVVCEDPGLVAADRRMVRAYTQATAAGAPADGLWQEQVRWLNAREAAAQRSPAAVESLYRQRINDLEAEASSGPR